MESGDLTHGRGKLASWWRENALAIGLIFPAIAVLTVIIILPALNLFWISFNNYSPGIGSDFVGLGNYTSLIRDTGFQAAALRNVAYVVGVVLLQLLTGMGIALLLDNALPLRTLWTICLIAPFAVSPIVAVVSWKYLLDPSFGLVNYLITRLGLPPVPWFNGPATSMAGVVIVAVWKGFSFIAIILFAALRAIPSELKEAARIDGATPLQVFRYVKFPLILPALSIVALFEIIHAVREFDIIQTMTGGGPGTSTELFSNYLYRQAFGNFYFGLGASVGWIMLVVTVVLASPVIWRTYQRMFSLETAGR
ncbi:MAG TPA: sugar ABC transporter permease [Dongiaceae bacterium]|nr:sugar ABC transporter permease [Dongiaceae bacterium]